MTPNAGLLERRDVASWGEQELGLIGRRLVESRTVLSYHITAFVNTVVILLGVRVYKITRR